jgi:hypothetical protein
MPEFIAIKTIARACGISTSEVRKCVDATGAIAHHCLRSWRYTIGTNLRRGRPKILKKIGIQWAFAHGATQASLDRAIAEEAAAYARQHDGAKRKADAWAFLKDDQAAGEQ